MEPAAAGAENRATWGAKGRRSGDRQRGSQETWGAALVPGTAETSAFGASPGGKTAEGVAGPALVPEATRTGQAGPGLLGPLKRGFAGLVGRPELPASGPFQGLLSRRAFLTRDCIRLQRGCPRPARPCVGLPRVLGGADPPRGLCPATHVGVIAIPCPAPRPPAPHRVAPATQRPGRCRIPQGQGPPWASKGAAHRPGLGRRSLQGLRVTWDLPEGPGQLGL